MCMNVRECAWYPCAWYPCACVCANCVCALRPGAQACHQIGKWHCGMSIDAHLPINRGFASSFGYLAGAEDHFKDTRGDFVDLWRSASPAFGENGTVGELTYNTYKFTKEALSIIDNHPPMQVRQRYNLSTFYTTQT